MNLKTILKNLSALIFALLVHLNGFSQCTITAPKTICIGDLGYFNISVPSGSTLLSVDWQFGDGYSASLQNTGHLYLNTGNYKVKCKLNLTSGSCQDSVMLDVLKLPISDFSFKQRDTCFHKNKISILNKSTAANLSQPIVKKFMIWGDGSIDSVGSTASHTYTQKANFKVSLETTDNMGCKHIKSVYVNIVPSLVAKIIRINDSLCGQTIICFKNSTDTILNSKNKFTWQFDNGARISSDYKTLQCLTYTSSSDLNVKLIVSNIFGCNDSITTLYKVKVYSHPKFNFVLPDTSVCYGSTPPYKVSITPAGSFQYDWEINGTPYGYYSYQKDLNFKKENFAPGKQKLKCIITNEACTTKVDTNFTIRGPKAQIQIFNKIQCDTAERVFFVDKTTVVDFKKSSRLWVLEDSYGDSCICSRRNNINKNRNCNYSIDNYHKHNYTIKKSVNKVSFYVSDSITRCGDAVKDTVNTNACGFVKPQTFCGGSLFLSNFKAYKIPIKFSLDSGITWINFPGTVDYPYKGLYSVLLKYDKEKEKAEDYMDDSIRIYKDTAGYTYLYLKDFLYVNENPNSEFTFTLTGKCTYKDIVLKLNNPIISGYETLIIDWGDGKSDTIFPKSIVVSDSINHRYAPKHLISNISVRRKYSNGCNSQYYLPIEYGINMFLDTIKSPCVRNEVCFTLSVYDIAKGQIWDNTNQLGTIKLLTGESKIISNDFAPCYSFTSEGKKTVKLIAASALGCTDSVSINVNVSNLMANYTNDSKYFGCGEIKQLHDSSLMISPANNDSITEWLWDFGSKTYSTTQKNPYQTFTKYGTYEVTHIVKSKRGCIDSAKFIVTVVGPQPQFDISTDTIGCEPLTVKFKNNSKNCSQYYWRFGDPSQNTLLNNTNADVTFTYTTPGKYYIKLTGIDTFYSTSTQSLYFCQENFPYDTTKRSVTVLPFLKAGFESPDTVCVGEEIDFKNTSDTLFKTLNWDFGGTKRTMPNTSMIPFTFTKSGSYKIRLKPDYPFTAGVLRCSDSAEKIIIAKGILANFEFERFCESPLLKFKNTSLPENNKTQYSWDFGQPNFPNNESYEKHPQHDYGFNKGDFVVCLQLKDEYGCTDSVCQIIPNDYKTKLLIPNVFTPRSMDGKNDEYDIVMEGEEIYDLSIFNRWGQILYHSATDSENGDGLNWNGRVENTGIICPSGTYFYIFEYKNCYGDLEKKRVSGTITLIR